MSEQRDIQAQVDNLEMESNAGSIKVKYAGLVDSSWLSQFTYGSNPWMARYVYGLVFLLTNLLAWAFRDYGRRALKILKRFKGCEGGPNCYGTDGVLRVSMGCCMFFFLMFLSTLRTSKFHDRRDSWHSGWWTAKALLFIVLMVLPFLVPNALVLLYGEIAHFGAGVFLLVQLISIISFITWVNECCLSEKNAERCRIYVLVMATASYVACLAGAIMMYIWYVPEPSCLLNIFYVTSTLVLVQLMTTVSLYPKVNAGFLAPGLMGLYIVFICWCAIRSEPPGTRCNRRAEASHKTDWLTLISFIIALLSMVIATFSTGVDSQSFQFKKDKKAKAEDDVPYGYGFFHFVFATGAMYFAMLLIGWNTHHSMKKWTIDVGWTSTWVRVVNGWLAAFVYIWMVVAPAIMRCRENGEFLWANR